MTKFMLEGRHLCVGDRVTDLSGNMYTIVVAEPDTHRHVVACSRQGNYVMLDVTTLRRWECDHDDLAFEVELDGPDVIIVLTCQKCGEVREGSISFTYMTVIGEQP